MDSEHDESSGHGWQELLHGANAVRCAVVAGGMVMHATTSFIVVTILPTVVREIGGLRYFAWATTLYIVASLLGGSVCARLLARLGARGMYRSALAVFALGSLICALAPSMPVLLAGRLVQGLGAGTLSALSFTMVRTLFPERLWPRAISVVSASWGIATLSGPALGGMFAQANAWRWAFWFLFLLAPVLLAVVESALPRDLARPRAPRSRLALVNLGVLAASALAVSIGSSRPEVPANLGGLALAVAGLALFIRLERRGGLRLLPSGGCDLGSPLGPAYAAMLTLIIGITTEIFVPYFLQMLQGVRPLYAGYISAVMSAGWTLGSVGGSAQSGRAARLLMRCGPLVMAGSLLALLILMPSAQPFPALRLWAIGLVLVTQGLGIGLAWPHLAARVFGGAPDGERDIAASSVTVIIMVANAFGSALGGLVTTLAGLTTPGGAVGAAHAATALFGVFALSPLLAFLAVRRLLRATLPGLPVPVAPGTVA